MEPLVSVVVPSYNYNNLTELLIRSVQAQTYRNWQLVVVDDCSTDDTPSVLGRYRGVDDRIEIVLKTANEGMAKTLNDGFARARGEYFIGMNADDCLAEPDAIEKLVARIRRDARVGLVYTDNWVIDSRGDRVEVFRKPTRTASDLLAVNFIGTWSCIWRGDVFARIGRRVEFDMCCDWDLWLKLSEHCEIAHLPEPLFGWFRHDDSLYFRERPKGVVDELQCVHNARRRRGAGRWSRESLRLTAKLYGAKTALWLDQLRGAH